MLGPGQDGKTIQPEGLKASAMNEQQRTMLLDVISEWAGIIHESAAAARMAELKADINETWFAWSGPTTAAPGKNISAYYRIQGPHLVIEYAPQTLGGDPSLHVHTMYRDPTNDYGRGACEEMKTRLIATVAILLSLQRSHPRTGSMNTCRPRSSRWRQDHVQASMRLIPGVAVSSRVIASIDTNGDGVISEAEQRAYAERVLRDLSLTVDGEHLSPGWSPQKFPAIEEMREGAG